CNKSPHRYSRKRLILTNTRKFNTHFIIHEATPKDANANSSFSSKRTILNNPDISHKRMIEGEMEHTTISPPSCSVSLYLPKITPNPELSIKDISPKLTITCFIGL